MNLNNFTLSPNCCHENVQFFIVLLTVGTVDLEKKALVFHLLFGHLLENRGLKNKVRIFMNIC